MRKLLVDILLVAFLLTACGKAGLNDAQVLNTEGIEQESETQQSTESVIESEVTEEINSEVVESEVVEDVQTEIPSETPPPSEQPAPPPVEMESWASGYYVYDPHNTRGLSNVKKGHVYGVAANGQCNVASLNAQKYFDNFGGLKALVVDRKSTEKVLYLTFSCGYEYNNNTVKILDILKEKDVKAAFFGELGYFRNNPHLTTRFIAEGHILGNHTATHPDFPKLSRNEMASQVYRVDKYLKGAEYSFNTVTSRLHPGAVVVLHVVSNDSVEALGAIIDYAREQGYVFKTLDDYPW